MGKPDLHAGPSSQALTGGNKKFSSRLGEESYEFEDGHSKRISMYGCCGTSWRDIRLMVFALATLYAFVALFYLGLMTAALEVRQEEWLELQDRFFGPFSKVERMVYNSSNQRVQMRKFTIDEFENLPDADQQIFTKTFNRPSECNEVTVEGETFLKCDEENEEDGRWVLFPWVTDSIGRFEGDATGCKVGQTWTTLELGGKYGRETNTADEVLLGPNTCLTYIPTSAVPETAAASAEDTTTAAPAEDATAAAPAATP